MIEDSFKDKEDVVRFFQYILHDLKTPISSIQVWADLFRDPEAEEYMGQCVQEIERICKKVDHQITTAAIITRYLLGDSLDSNKRLLESSEIIRSIQFQFTQIVKQSSDRNLKICIEENSFSLPKDTKLKVDKFMIMHALRHVIQNAINYSYSETDIKISGAINQTGSFGISVTNTGLLPTEEDISHCTEFRWRGERAKQVRAGNGIGLWIANEILNVNEGSFELHSDNAATTATLWLPLQYKTESPS